MAVSKMWFAVAMFLIVFFFGVNAFSLVTSPPLQSSSLRARSSFGSSRSGELSMSLFADVSTVVAENQLATDVVSSGVLAGIGDVIAQKQQQQQSEEEGENEFDKERFQQFVFKGLGSGLLWSFWFGLSDQWCNGISSTQQILPEMPSYTLASITLEQFLWCPIVYSCWDLPVPALLSGVPVSEIPGQIRQKLGGLLLANAKVWTLVNLVVYSIPLEWRVVLTTVVDMFWQSVVSKTVSAEMIEAGNEVIVASADATMEQTSGVYKHEDGLLRTK